MANTRIENNYPPTSAQNEDHYNERQERAFTKWCNVHLKYVQKVEENPFLVRTIFLMIFLRKLGTNQKIDMMTLSNSALDDGFILHALMTSLVPSMLDIIFVLSFFRSFVL